MKTNYSRREFIHTTGAAALVAAALPVWAQDDKKITVAFVGVAHIHTPGYLNEVKKHDSVRIKYVWDHDPKRAERSAEKVGAAAVADVKTIWSDPEITAVII